MRGVADVATSIAIDHTGKIVVGGLSATGSFSDGSLSSDFLVIRYTATGTVDRTFGGGPVITSFGQPAAITQVFIDADGTILASGKSVASLSGLDTSHLQVAIARYTTNGKLDTTFNGSGTLILGLNGTSASPAAQAADARISPQTQSFSTFEIAGVFSPLSLSPADTGSSLLNEFQQFEQSAQGTIAVTMGGELLDVGNSGSNTVEAEIVTSGIDLTAALTTKLPASAPEGAKETLSVLVSEGGTLAATGTVTIQLFASPDGQIDPGLTPFASVPERVSLKHGQSHSFMVHYVFPSTVGTYSIVANVVDPASFTELNEGNNFAASTTQVQLAPPYVDLAASALTISGTPAVGKTVTLTFSVADNGNTAARSAPLEILASPDGTIANGTPIMRSTLPLNLSPNRVAKHFRATVRIPSTLGANTYVLVAVLDPNNTLNDPNLTNNVLVGTQTFTVG